VYLKYTNYIRGTCGSLRQTLDSTSAFTVSQYDEKWSMGLVVDGAVPTTGTLKTQT